MGSLFDYGSAQDGPVRCHLRPVDRSHFSGRLDGEAAIWTISRKSESAVGVALGGIDKYRLWTIYLTRSMLEDAAEQGIELRPPAEEDRPVDWCVERMEGLQSIVDRWVSSGMPFSGADPKRQMVQVVTLDQVVHRGMDVDAASAYGNRCESKAKASAAAVKVAQGEAKRDTLKSFCFEITY